MALQVSTHLHAQPVIRNWGANPSAKATEMPHATRFFSFHQPTTLGFPYQWSQGHSHRWIMRQCHYSHDNNVGIDCEIAIADCNHACCWRTIQSCLAKISVLAQAWCMGILTKNKKLQKGLPEVPEVALPALQVERVLVLKDFLLRVASCIFFIQTWEVEYPLLSLARGTWVQNVVFDKWLALQVQIHV